MFKMLDTKILSLPLFDIQHLVSEQVALLQLPYSQEIMVSVFASLGP